MTISIQYDFLYRVFIECIVIGVYKSTTNFLELFPNNSKMCVSNAFKNCTVHVNYCDTYVIETLEFFRYLRFLSMIPLKWSPSVLFDPFSYEYLDTINCTSAPNR